MSSAEGHSDAMELDEQAKTAPEWIHTGKFEEVSVFEPPDVPVTQLPLLYGVHEYPTTKQYLKPVTARVLVFHLKQQGLKAERVSYALKHLKTQCDHMTWISSKRLKVTQNRFQKQQSRREYRKQYNERPHVKAKIAEKKADPQYQLKKKEYNKAPETRNKKKEARKIRGEIINQIRLIAGNRYRDILDNPGQLSAILGGA